MKSLEVLAGEVAQPAPTPAPSAAATEAAAITTAPVAPPLGESLESLVNLEWELNDATGVLTGEIEMGAVTIDNFWGVTTTRAFNGQVRFLVW